MTHSITFGTSGHRGIVGDSFSQEHVSAIAYAIAKYLNENFEKPAICLGYDNRQGNSPNLEAGSYTEIIVKILTANNVDVYFYSQYCPTPVVAFSIEHLKLSGGIVLTASHNPPAYNGLKFNDLNGAPAGPEITSIIQNYANQFYQNPPKLLKQKGVLKKITDFSDFAEHIKKIQTHFFPDETGDLSIAVDSRHGATAACWQQIFNSLQTNSIHYLNADPLPDFGQLEPNPTKKAAIDSLSAFIVKHKLAMGIANDPDGDRHILLDEKGEALSPELTAVILLDYFVSSNIAIYGIATTLASSCIIKKAAQRLDLNYEETAVGFKYFSSFFQTARQKNRLGIAVESSGGISLSTHTFEKCGFLPGILIANILKKVRKPLSEIKKEILQKYGEYTFTEDQYTFTATKKDSMQNFIQNISAEFLSKKLNAEICELNKSDGTKMVFTNEDWALIRLSGTEPVARLYAESSSQSRSEKWVNCLKELLKEAY